jgi:NAD-dependent deacetylase
LEKSGAESLALSWRICRFFEFLEVPLSLLYFWIEQFMNQSEAWPFAVETIKQANHILILTGAGISASSGIPTFRDRGGLWSEFTPARFATWPGLLISLVSTPKKVAQFLIGVLEPIVQAKPNAAHNAIHKLEEVKKVTIVTQNIDRIHQRAGSTNVVELHGTLFEQ